ncbi:hypothetical protein PF011_g27272 [Phytophthora fragariae]|uniref:Uncharacterized protein n=1 Tax=Phytophthora fragariae TaxID=53985 RepID=A0A6A3HIT1_9STRA|nr:hypothetical protein PF011_g27272 [Phytophthora fragariae]
MTFASGVTLAPSLAQSSPNFCLADIVLNARSQNVTKAMSTSRTRVLLQIRAWFSPSVALVVRTPYNRVGEPNALTFDQP